MDENADVVAEHLAQSLIHLPVIRLGPRTSFPNFPLFSTFGCSVTLTTLATLNPECSGGARVWEREAAIGIERPKLRIPLPPALKERLKGQRGDFVTLNNPWGKSNSETVHERLKEDPSEWYLYHTLYREAREGCSEVPALRIAEDLMARTDLRVGDFGAGDCLLREALPSHQVVSLDHVAVDDGVIACDMAKTPLEDGSLGAAVFSLSLMGRNWREYLKEAHRTLQPYGLLFIAEPAHNSEGKADLEEALEAAGFELLPSTRRGDFLYLRGIKVG